MSAKQPLKENKEAMIKRIQQELYSRLNKGLTKNESAIMKPNWEITAKIAKEEKYVRFNEWFKKNGGRATSW